MYKSKFLIGDFVVNKDHTIMGKIFVVSHRLNSENVIETKYELKANGKEYYGNDETLLKLELSKSVE